jgi:hypothetical protein
MTSQSSSPSVLDASSGDGKALATGAEGWGALWYPVGVLVTLLAASGAFVLCFSGQWIG